jgi:hypothetical protein
MSTKERMLLAMICGTFALLSLYYERYFPAVVLSVTTITVTIIAIVKR